MREEFVEDNENHQEGVKYINTIYDFFRDKTDEEKEELIAQIRKLDNNLGNLFFWVNSEENFIIIGMDEFSINGDNINQISGSGMHIDSEKYKGNIYLESIYNTIVKIKSNDEIKRDENIKDTVDNIIK